MKLYRFFPSAMGTINAVSSLSRFFNLNVGGGESLQPSAFLHTQLNHYRLNHKSPTSRIIRHDAQFRQQLCFYASQGNNLYSKSNDASCSDFIDPSGFYPEENPVLRSSSWNVYDDWSVLSTATTAVSSPQMSLEDSFNVVDVAARILVEQDKITEEEQKQTRAWHDVNHIDSDEASKKSNGCGTFIKDEVTKEDEFVQDSVEIISCHLDYNDTIPLYDTMTLRSKAYEETKNNIKNEEHQDNEIAFFIRCNQTPEQFLISQGRVLPELTHEMKYSVEFLLEKGDYFHDLLPFQPKMTPYFKNAVRKIFEQHSIQIERNYEVTDVKINPATEMTQVEPLQVLDRNSLSAWMTKSLSFAFSSGDENGISKQRVHIGPYDKSINAILSRYSRVFGSGYLTLDEFLDLYLECAWAGYVHDIRSSGFSIDGKRYRIPSVDHAVIFHGKKNTEKILKDASLLIVWRDFEAHSIFSPVEEERFQLLMNIERIKSAKSNTKESEMVMNECEFLDEYEDRLYHSIDSDEDSFQGTNRAWKNTERREKSSHELVELSFDGRTPKRIRDGQFVFIDEESCIGCTQCAQIAPSSFKMIENTGRARTFFQSSAIDIEHAVSSCPVNCMHMVSFDELKEMEYSRDKGDGRDDHRHFGHGRTHTPLHVAGRDSDANHKSSWYHHLKSKCHGSVACPKRGCYDCPSYAPGKNPYFIAHHQKAEHIRALDFMDSGVANKWRKFEVL